MTPRNTGATRSARFAEVLRSRPAGYALGIGMIGSLVAGAALGSAVTMMVAPLAVAALVMMLAWRAAKRRAATDFYSAFAHGHGFEYWREYGLLPLTPLLGAGDRRRCEHYMTGPLGGRSAGLDCGLGLYTFETREGSDEDGNARRRAHHFTVCVVDIEAAISLFPGLFLQRRRDLVGRFTEENWLDRHGRTSVELESVAFTDRYELLVDRYQDGLLLRELFAPSLIVWLAGHPLAPCFEFRAGVLVVYVRRRLKDSGSLNQLLEATNRIASRITGEVEERSRAAVLRPESSSRR